jgi:hypothetical protein
MIACWLSSHSETAGLAQRSSLLTDVPWQPQHSYKAFGVPKWVVDIVVTRISRGTKPVCEVPILANWVDLQEGGAARMFGNEGPSETQTATEPQILRAVGRNSHRPWVARSRQPPRRLTAKMVAD